MNKIKDMSSKDDFLKEEIRVKTEGSIQQWEGEEGRVMGVSPI